MSDIFISYSSKDRDWTQRLAKALVSQGWSVWWDRQIPTGQSFDAVIEQELDRARCVVVVWSQHSAQSDWVKTEAAQARRRGVLLPVMMDRSGLPLEFSRLQTPSLCDWKEGCPHSGFDRLVQDVTRLIGASSPVHPAQTRRSWRPPVPRPLLVSVPTVMALIGAGVLMTWNVPTRLVVEIIANRVEFTIDPGPAQARQILDSLHVHSLTVEKFSAVSMKPETVKIADPAQYRLEDDTFPSSAWRPLALEEPRVSLTVTDERRHPKLTLEPRKEDRTAGLRVEPITAEAATKIVLEAKGQRNDGLIIKISARRPVTLSMPRQFEAIAEHTEINGVKGPSYRGQAELSYRVRLPESDRAIEIDGQGDGPIMSVRFAPAQPTSLLPPDRTIPVATLAFERQDELGDRSSALTGEGKIQYPGYPEIGEVSFKPPDVIDIDRLERFHITELSLDRGSRGIKVVAEGIADRFMRKRGDFAKDLRMTAFDVLRHHPRVMALAAILGWILPTSMGVYKFYREP